MLETEKTNLKTTGKLAKRLAVAAVALLAVTSLGVPSAQADLHGPYKDLSTVVDAGEYVAYRIEMPNPGWVWAGGEFLDAQSSDSVLPIVNFIDQVGSAYAATAGFYYDDFRDEPAAVDLTIVNEELGNHNIHTHDKRIGSSPFPGLYFYMPAGTYNMVGLTGPADGEAELFLEVPEDAIVLDEQRGEAVWARGLDESTFGYDLSAQSQYGLAQSDIHEWYYTGADVDVTVDGSFYGYMGFGRYTEAQWLRNGQVHNRDWVIGEPAGDWTMSFPEERYQWKNCVSVLCVGDESQNTRLYPPYAIGVDVLFG